MLRYAVEMFTYTKIHHWKKISCYFSKYHPMHIHNLLNNFSKMLIEFFHEKIPEIYCRCWSRDDNSKFYTWKFKKNFPSLDHYNPPIHFHTTNKQTPLYSLQVVNAARFSFLYISMTIPISAARDILI